MYCFLFRRSQARKNGSHKTHRSKVAQGKLSTAQNGHQILDQGRIYLFLINKDNKIKIPEIFSNFLMNKML